MQAVQNALPFFSCLFSLPPPPPPPPPVPPEGAKIVTPNSPLTAGREYAVACRVWGSNPPARVEWFRGPRSQLRPVPAFNQTVSPDGNVTVSWVRYVPEPGHHHQTLTCRWEWRSTLSDSTVDSDVLQIGNFFFRLLGLDTNKFDLDNFSFLN